MTPAELELREAKRELRAARAVLEAARRMSEISMQMEFLFNPPTMVHAETGGRPLSRRRVFCRGKVYVEVQMPETQALTPRLMRFASMMKRRWE